MNIVITGGAGFLGARLARHLLALRRLSLAGAPEQAITQVTLVDQTAAPADLAQHAMVQSVVGELNVSLANGQALPADTTIVYHLAAAVSGECEADFDLGMRSNLAATEALLAACRRLGTQPTVVFASSLAVFGDSPETPLPHTITDTTLPTPQTSYGIQKFIGEQLVADYGRKGFIRARNVRLMTVSVRPGRPNGAASSFFSGMIREPLSGLRGACPVPPQTAVALSSPTRTVEGLVRAVTATDAEWGARTAVNLPALTTTVGDMAAALERVAGRATCELIDWTPDANIQRIVKTWPSHVDAARARGLGLLPDTSFETIVRDYVRENPDAVRVKLLNPG
jgi:nucleoside-diphosphate-sugar epimerase